MRIGVDPGLQGAVAVVDDSLKCLGLADMPLMALGKNHQQINAAALAVQIDEFAHWAMWKDKKENTTVYLEQVSAMPKQGVTSMFNFGVSYGVVIGICGALQIPLVLVRPNAWKKTAGLIGKPKDAARTLAQQLYPEQDLSQIGRAHV